MGCLSHVALPLGVLILFMLCCVGLNFGLSESMCIYMYVNNVHEMLRFRYVFFFKFHEKKTYLVGPDKLHVSECCFKLISFHQQGIHASLSSAPPVYICKAHVQYTCTYMPGAHSHFSIAGCVHSPTHFRLQRSLFG